jgi:beta-exotoxin I transport system permease protein
VISGPLLRQTWRAQRARVAVIAVALAIWSFLLPVIYATFGRQMESLIRSGIIPESFLRLMGSSVFGLDAAIALGVGHPIAIALQIVYPVGFAAAAIAGERQRGTLEVLLARPVSRRSVFVTLLAAILGIAVVTTAASVAGTVAGSAAYGLTGELDAADEGLLFLNTVLLLAALAGISLAASASFDRLGPAIAISLGVVLVGYMLEILGQLWPDAEVVQPYSPFHYLRPFAILGGQGKATDLLVLLAVFAVAVSFGLWRFPRRDLAAPS